MAKKPNKVLNYFKEVKSELKKVVWPSFKQIKNNTLIVIACVLIIGAFIWILDAVFDISLGRIIKSTQQKAVEQSTDTDAEQNGEEISQEEYLEAMQSYLQEFGINFDGEKYTDADGNELTEEQVNEIIENANPESTDGGAEDEE